MVRRTRLNFVENGILSFGEGYNFGVDVCFIDIDPTVGFELIDLRADSVSSFRRYSSTGESTDNYLLILKPSLSTALIRSVLVGPPFHVLPLSRITYVSFHLPNPITSEILTPFPLQL